MADRRKHPLLVVALLVLASGIAASPAQAAVKDCDVRIDVPNRTLSGAGVSSVRNMSCKAARRAIHRNGKRQKNAAYGEVGSRFRLGRWSCTVYYFNYELWKSRCTRGSRAFRVEYGF
jgi:hypothetical protein